MKKLIIIIAALFFITGCASFMQPQQLKDGAGIEENFKQQIRDWQKRIKKEGWSVDMVDEISYTCTKYSQYTSEKVDHWDTYKEMIAAKFKGDCEDMAVLFMGALKNLGYPYQVRILAVNVYGAPILSHAITKVELPDHSWKIYQSVPNIMGAFDEPFYVPIAEWDEDNIWVYGVQGSKVTHEEQY